jgi:aminoglycoside phosphotransferase (APT) family kinase protein
VSESAGGADLGASLARFLERTWDAPVRVENLRVASAGARRRNVLFDAERDGERIGLVATIVPARAVQVMEIEVEASLLRLAEEAGVPAPHVHAVCDDAEVVGGPFFVTECIEGETIPRRVLRLVESRPGLGARLARQCGEALARLHAVDPPKAHPKLARPGGEGPVEQALAATEPQLAALAQPSPAFALALRWLERNRPPPAARSSVIHGDFRNGNLVVGPDGLRAALDWEVAHVGDPMEDLGWLCQRMWRFRNDAREVGGFAGRADLASAYQAAGGAFCAASFHWWKLFGTLRWGIGLGLQAQAHLDGSFRSIVMAASGRRVAELEYDALMLLRRAYED